MKISIVGGGNIGTQFAVHCAHKGHEVTMYTSAPELFDRHLSIVDENGKVTLEADIKAAVSDPEKAFREAEAVLITVPAMVMKETAETIYRHSEHIPMIGVVPGNGGSECAFRKCMDRGDVFFGIERVPAIARLVKKGSIVRSVGYRNELHVAAIPAKESEKCAAFVESIFDIKTRVIPEYLNQTMTPSNPVLHTSRLYSLFKDWHEGVSYDRLPLFYEEWDDASSEMLFACDEEVQKICRELKGYELKYVKSLKEHYEAPTVEAMTAKISSIPAFKGIQTPAVKTEGGYIPDLNSRYFTADFSYGLSIIKQLGSFAKADTPVIDMLLGWYRSISDDRNAFRYEDYGIGSLEELEVFYHRGQAV